MTLQMNFAWGVVTKNHQIEVYPMYYLRPFVLSGFLLGGGGGRIGLFMKFQQVSFVPKACEWYPRLHQYKLLGN